MAYYKDETHRQKTIKAFVRRNGKTGYLRGQWQRRRKWPFASLPIHAALVFACPVEANRARACATKLAKATTMRFVSDTRPDGHHIWRIA